MPKINSTDLTLKTYSTNSRAKIEPGKLKTLRKKQINRVMVNYSGGKNPNPHFS